MNGSAGQAVDAAEAGAQIDGIRARGSRRSLSAAELAKRIRRGSRATAALLEQLAEAGYVECDAAGGWRLTPVAELDLGAVFRRIELPDVDHSSWARPRRRRR